MVSRVVTRATLVAALAWVVQPAMLHVSVRDSASTPHQVKVPTNAEMERDLHAALNAERASRHLQSTRLSEELSEIARSHSRDLARRNVLSHESEDGKSTRQRLTDAGVGFVACGENVCRSGTLLTNLIHQSFLDSPTHRENMLTPAWDVVGIGVVQDDRGTYFVTVDFIKSFVPKPAAEIRALMAASLNRARAKAGRKPVELLEQASAMADTFARAEAEGKPRPTLPEARFRHTALYVTGGDLDDLQAYIGGLDVRGYGLGGIGVAFVKNEKYPGGAYVICLFLVWDGS